MLILLGIGILMIATFHYIRHIARLPNMQKQNYLLLRTPT